MVSGHTLKLENQDTKAPHKTIVPAMVQECVKRGLIIEPAGRWNQVARFLAPLVITDEQQLEKGFEIFEEALQVCLKG